MTDEELLAREIANLDVLLEMIEEDWESDIIQNDKVWFAQLVVKARGLRTIYENQRSQLVGQTPQE